MDLHQVFLMVSDYEESYEFYAETLGLTVNRESDGHAEFDTGACSLVIEREFDEETLASFGLEPPGERRGAGAILVVEVEDVDGTYERLDAQDVPVLKEPQDVPWGRRMFLVKDPDGYVLEVSRPS